MTQAQDQHQGAIARSIAAAGRGPRATLASLCALAALVCGLAAAPAARARTATGARTATAAWGTRHAGGRPLARAAAPAPGASALGASGTASLAGTVTAAEGEGEALEGIEVCASALGEVFASACAATGASGEYEVTGLPAGEYAVEFFVPEGTPLNYLTQYYHGRAGESEADPVTLVEGAKTSGIDAALLPGAQIAGTVTTAAEGEGEAEALEGIEVCALEPATGLLERCALTDAAGAYTIPSLATGSYQVEFAVPFESELAYATQFYDGVSARSLAEAVPVTAGGPTAEHIDAAMSPGGSIAGKVTAAGTEEGLAEALVCAWDPGSEVGRCTLSLADGAYTLRGLPSGSYIVEFSPGTSAYGVQYYDGKAEESEADRVAVTAPLPSAGIDAALRAAPASLSRPTIAGRAVEGQTLAMTPGTWSEEPTSQTDEWGRCGALGVIESCYTIAEGPTYTLTADDVGHTIRIREKAVNAVGEGIPAFSPPTAVVAAAAEPAAIATAPPPAIGLGGSGVLSTTARAATTAQLKALLAKLLVPRGKGARVAALRRRHRYVTTFGSLAAGRLAVAWFARPRRGRKPVRLAAGVLATKASGKAKLTIELTAAGRTLLAKGKPVELTAKGTFAPSGRPALTARRFFRLRR